MTNEEKIKAEVERLKDVQSSPIELCNDLISFIDSLPEEPVSEDLKEAAINAAMEDMCDRQIMECSSDERLRYSRIFRRGFKAGVNWQKEQMMKNSVWHNSDEKPANNKECLVKTLPNNAYMVMTSNSSHFDLVTEWAYLNDLIKQ